MTQSSVLTRLTITIGAGVIALVALLILFAAEAQQVQAAPAVRPLSDIFTKTMLITHTNATTHEMAVYGNGQIVNQFRTDNATKTDQIGNSISHTTLAVAFDQHGSSVDVGWQGDFTTTGPITLNTDSSFPNTIEDTEAIYASKVLSYQITQRTLAINSNNCVIMQLFILNTGNTPLTGGKLLYMIDVQVGELPISDIGGFDASRNLLHQADYNKDTGFGYAAGIALLEGTLEGYGANTITSAPNPADDTSLNSQMDFPSNSIVDGADNIIWLVANIGDLPPDDATRVVFSICARSVTNPGWPGAPTYTEPEMEELARQALFITYSDLVNLEVIKEATPPSGGTVVVGDPLTYTVAVTGFGEVYVDNIIIVDRIPVSTSLISYSVSQGSIIAVDGVITAMVGRLDPDETVLMNIVISPSLSLPNGTIITNQAFITGEPIVIQTNVVTHRIASLPAFSLTKQGVGSPWAVMGAPFTYTITITNTGGTTGTNVTVVDTVPAGSQHVSGGVESGNTVTWVISEIAPNGGTAQVNYVVTTCQTSLVNDGYEIITSTRGITAPSGPEVISTLVPPTLNPQFNYTPSQPGINKPVSFDGTSSTTNGGPIVDWDWDFGDSETGNGAITNHIYAAPGTYTVTLTVTDTCNFQTTTTDTITIFLPDLLVTKQAAPEPVLAGDRLTYTITISNPSVVDATGVIVADPLPNNTTFVPGSVDIEPASAGGALDVPPTIASGFTVTAGSLVTLTYQVAVASPLADGTLITNTASVSSSEVATPTLATATSTVTSSPLLQIVKSATPSPNVEPGEIITYTIVVNNEGNADATNAVISDSLPANTQFVPNSIRLRPIGAGDEGSVPPLLASNLSITAGQKVTVTYAVRVDTPLDDGTTITNTASVTSLQTPELITDSIVTLVASSPDLRITKFASQNPVSPGDVLTYTIVVRNEGDANATGAVISDPLPDNTSFISGSPDLEPNGAGTLGLVPPTLVSDLVVTAGQRVTLTFAVTVNTPLANGIIITNTASVTSPQEATPKIRTITTTVSAVPGIQLVKTGPASAAVSSTVVYTFTLTNVGNTPLQDIALVDDLIGPITNLLPGSDDNNDQLDFGENWVYTASYTIPVTASSPLTNTAVVTATDGLFTTVTDSDSHAVVIDYNPILRLTKTGPSTATFGSPVTFTLRVRHETGSDGSPVDGVIVSDNYAGVAIFRGGDTTPNNKLDANEIWTYEAKFTINATIDSNPLVNTGTVTAKDLGGETVTAVATHSTTLSGFNPVLFVDKDGPARGDVGDTISYTFDIINVNSLSVAKFKLEKRISMADMGDGSPITLTNIDDPNATGITYVGGDSNGNGKIDGGEKWIFAASHTITLADADPLINVVNVVGEDLEEHQVEATSSHSTNIVQNPFLRLVATGPVTGETGSELELTLTIDHAENSDGSPVSNITVKGGSGSDLTGVVTLTGGDDNTNNILEATEQWIYSFKYIIPPLSPSPLVIRTMTEGRDLDNDIIAKSYNYTISTSPGPLLFFPLILKN